MKSKTTLCVVIPVYNEEVDLLRNIPVLNTFLEQNLKDYAWEIIIADNGPSKDGTAKVSRELASKFKNVKYVCIPRPGRGNALREVWLSSKSDILCYMDVDLSSDLKFLSKLVGSIEEGFDLAIGSRLKRGGQVYDRTLMREVMSRGYNTLIKIFFGTNFQDAQCGFKAISNRAAHIILPLVIDTAWFFDSELLIIAEKAGFKIAEIPIVWRDDPRSTVKVAKTAWGDLQGLARLFISRPWKRVLQ